jgi:hypothetical protein
MDDFANRSLPMAFGPLTSNRCCSCIPESDGLWSRYFALSYLTVTDFARFLG